MLPAGRSGLREREESERSKFKSVAQPEEGVAAPARLVELLNPRDPRGGRDGPLPVGWWHTSFWPRSPCERTLAPAPARRQTHLPGCSGSGMGARIPAHESQVQLSSHGSARQEPGLAIVRGLFVEDALVLPLSTALPAESAGCKAWGRLPGNDAFFCLVQMSFLRSDDLAVCICSKILETVQSRSCTFFRLWLGSEALSLLRAQIRDRMLS